MLYLKKAFQGSSAIPRDFIAARMDSLELTHVEFLVDEANLEVYTIRRGQIDTDLIDIEPQEEPLDLNALEAGDRAIAELARDGRVVEDHVIELNIAGLG